MQQKNNQNLNPKDKTSTCYESNYEFDNLNTEKSDHSPIFLIQQLLVSVCSYRHFEVKAVSST